MGVSVQAWQAHLGFHVAWMQAPLCAPQRGTLGVSSASGSQHKLRWPSGVWGWYVDRQVCKWVQGTRVHTHGHAHDHTLTGSPSAPECHSACPGTGGSAPRRSLPRERDGHQEQKDPHRPGDPQTPGRMPRPRQRQGKEPKDMGAEARETTE